MTSPAVPYEKELHRDQMRSDTLLFFISKKGEKSSPLWVTNTALLTLNFFLFMGLQKLKTFFEH